MQTLWRKVNDELPSEINSHPAHQYAVDVLSENILSCKWVKLACLRYFKDFQDAEKKGFYFDLSSALHRLQAYNYCCHSKGKWAGTVIKPEPWQQFIKWNVYGWKWQATKTRRFKIIYTAVARKNGKTTDLAVDGLYLTGYDGEGGAEVYTAASKKDQAIKIHGASIRMIDKSKFLKRTFSVMKNNINVKKTNSFYIPLGRDSKTEDGSNVHGALIDEYHAHKDSGMYDVLRSGMGAREQPMLYIITTAGFDTNSACYQEQEYAQSILNSVLDDGICDETYFAIIYTLDKDDDWKDEKNWIKANPSMHVMGSVFINDMRSMCKLAIDQPLKQVEFKTKKCNIWTEAAEIWIPQEKWVLNNTRVDPESLIGRRCIGAIDLSTSVDLTSFTLCFPPEKDEKLYQLLHWFFIPEENMRSREENDKVPYQFWVESGLVCATPGNVIDQDFIFNKITEVKNKYRIDELAYDPFGAIQLILKLTDAGLNCVEYRQGWKTFTPACNAFEEKVYAQEIAHSGNPVVNWMIGCTSLWTDNNNNKRPIKPDRGKSRKRIDGVVTSIMSLDRAIRTVDSKSVYEGRGIIILGDD